MAEAQAIETGRATIDSTHPRDPALPATSGAGAAIEDSREFYSSLQLHAFVQVHERNLHSLGADVEQVHQPNPVAGGLLAQGETAVK
ncbi:MAG: hypothetical protein AAGC68_08210 [Verrucomicrobiota bacterium]